MIHMLGLPEHYRYSYFGTATAAVIIIATAIATDTAALTQLLPLLLTLISQKMLLEQECHVTCWQIIVLSQEKTLENMCICYIFGINITSSLLINGH